MARKKPAQKAKKKSAAKPAARKSAKKSSKKVARKPVQKAAKKRAPIRAAKPARRSAASSAKASTSARTTAARRKPVKRSAKPTGKTAAKAKPRGRFQSAARSAPVAAGVKAALAPKKKPNLDRPRKTVADVHGIPSSLDLDRSASSAKSGRAEMRDKLSKSNSGGAAITAGDVDADWQSAESVGDEAPGGDNPTPDQDRVDDIGRALGVEYADDEELQGGAEIADRDLNRWELDPASKDDFDDEED
jgi:Family of unknown function (DUF6335)